MWNPIKKFQAWNQRRQAKKQAIYQDNPNEDALSAHDEKMAAAMQGQSPFSSEQAPVVQADHDEPMSGFKIDLEQLEANPDAKTSAQQMQNYQSSSYELYQVEEPQPVVIDFLEQIKSAIDSEVSASDESDASLTQADEFRAEEPQPVVIDFLEQIKSASDESDASLTQADEFRADDVIEFVLDQDHQASSDEIDENLASDLETAASKEQVGLEEVVKPVAKATSSAKTKKPAGAKSTPSKKPAAKKTNSANTKKASAKKPAAKKTPVKKS